MMEYVLSHKNKLNCVKKKQCVDENPEKINILVFCPKNGLVYCYFIEIRNPNKKALQQRNKKNLYGINFASDIQRFCYYPKTKDVYTFLGFSNQNELEAAIFQPSLRKSALNHQFYFFPLKKLPEYLSKPRIPNEQYIDESKKNVQVYQSIQFNSKIKFKKISLFIFLDVFHPIDNLFYCFFEEKDKPSGFISSSHLKSVFFADRIVYDIQRFVYHPEAHRVYTFFGFLTPEEREVALENDYIRSSAVNNKIFILNKNSKIYKKKHLNINSIDFNINKSFGKNSSNENSNHNIIVSYQSFSPKENFIYFYVVEETFASELLVENTKFKEYDIQRYCYFPGSSIVCSFYGFLDYHDLKNHFRLYSPKACIFPYFHFTKIYNFENEQCELNIKEFVPNEKLIYFYISEKEQNHHGKNEWEIAFQSLQSIPDAIDVQKMCYYPKTKEVYSFYGFKNKSALLKAIKHSVLEFKDIYNIQLYQKNDKKEFNSKNDNISKTIIISNLFFNPEDYCDQFKNENKVNARSKKKKLLKEPVQDSNSYQGFGLFDFEVRYINKNKKENKTPKIYLFNPCKQLFYLYFINEYSTLKNFRCENSSYFGIDKVDEIQIGFQLRLDDPHLYTFLGFKKSDDREKAKKILIKKKIKIFIYFNCDKSSSVAGKEDQSIDSKTNKLSIGNNSNNNKDSKKCESAQKLKFKTFEPKENIFYLFFEEIAHPTQHVIDKIEYKKIFGIDFAADVQRFCFHPETKKICTFIGFSSQNLMNCAKSNQSLKAASLNQNISIYTPQNSNENSEKNKNDSNGPKNSNQSIFSAQTSNNDQSISASSKINMSAKQNQNISKEKSKNNSNQKSQKNQNNLAGSKSNISQEQNHSKQQKKSVNDQFQYTPHQNQKPDDLKNSNNSNQKSQKNQNISTNSEIDIPQQQNQSSTKETISKSSKQQNKKEQNGPKNEQYNFSLHQNQNPDKLKSSSNSNQQTKKNPNASINSKNNTPQQQQNHNPVNEAISSIPNQQSKNSQKNPGKDRFRYTPQQNKNPSNEKNNNNSNQQAQKNQSVSTNVKSNLPSQQNKNPSNEKSNNNSNQQAQKNQSISTNVKSNLPSQQNKNPSNEKNNNSNQQAQKNQSVSTNIKSNLPPQQNQKSPKGKNKNESNQQNKNEEVISEKDQFHYSPKMNDDSSKEKIHFSKNQQNASNSNKIVKKQSPSLKFTISNKNESKKSIMEAEERYFIPDKRMKYIYLEEKSSHVSCYKTSNASLFGIKNINDLQRGYRMDSKDPTCYTFLGFKQSIDLQTITKNLSKQKDSINISSIKVINNNDEASLIDNEYDDYENNDDDKNDDKDNEKDDDDDNNIDDDDIDEDDDIDDIDDDIDDIDDDYDDNSKDFL